MRRAEGKREGEGGGKVISSLPPFFFFCLSRFLFFCYLYGCWDLGELVVGWLVGGCVNPRGEEKEVECSFLIFPAVALRFEIARYGSAAVVFVWNRVRSRVGGYGCVGFEVRSDAKV